LTLLHAEFSANERYCDALVPVVPVVMAIMMMVVGVIGVVMTVRALKTHVC